MKIQSNLVNTTWIMSSLFDKYNSILSRSYHYVYQVFWTNVAMYVLRLIRTPDKEFKSPRSLGVRVNESRLYIQ